MGHCISPFHIFFFKNQESVDKKVLLNVQQEPFFAKIVPPIDEQDELESRQLWAKVTKAIMNRNLDLAAYEKILVEKDSSRRGRSSMGTCIPFESKHFVEDEETHVWHYRFGYVKFLVPKCV
jgi:oxysterol-binding protein-related protein 8